MAKSKTRIFKQPVLGKPVSLEKFLRVFDTEMQLLNQQLMLAAEKGPVIVHDLRVTIKRLRALNLLVKAVDQQAYNKNNSSLRTVAKQFSGMRDREVIYTTLQKLIQKNPHLKLDPVTQSLLFRHRPTSLNTSVIDENTFAPLDLLPIEQAIDDGAIIEGLVANYRCCRRLWKNAFATSNDRIFHRWRRFVKYHYYQLSYFDFKEPGCKESAPKDKSLKQRLKRSKKLGSILGKDHDLLMLKKLLDRLPAVEDKPLLDVLADCRQLLRLEEEVLGEALFANKPKAFRRCLTSAWINGNGG